MSMTNADPVLRFLLGAAATGVLLVVLSALSPDESWDVDFGLCYFLTLGRESTVATPTRGPRL